MLALSVRYLFYQPMDEKDQNMDSSFSRQRNPLIWRRHCSISWPIVLQYDVKAISRIFSGMKFFRRSVRLTNQSHASLHSFDKPIKSLPFRLFIVSVLFASFRFKVIRKSHYKYGNSRLKTLKTMPCYAVHTRLGQISPPPLPRFLCLIWKYHSPGQLFLRLLDTSLKH